MFKLEAFFNPYLPVGQSRLDAVLTITSDATVSVAAAGRRVIGFVLDNSGSMNGEKLAQAKLAARRGIETLPAEAWFFVIAFNGRAQVLLPACAATATAKQLAHAQIQDLQAQGSTAMSRGLELALHEVRGCKAEIASIYFQTDGENGHDDTERLGEVIEQCRGHMQVDCRGIGTEWKPSELRRIASALMGTADAITDPQALADDFQRFLNKSMAKGIAGATLRLWSPKVIKTVLVKQMSPEIVDLLPKASRVDEKTLDIPLGAWGTESKDYQLSFKLPDGSLGDEVLACRATLLFQGQEGETKLTCDPIAATWSEDERLTTRINKEVAHYTGQTELADSIREGLEAQAQGDEDRATRLLGQAVRLAAQSGNEEVTRRLKKVVDVVDAASATVRLRKADKAAAMELDMGATRTVRRRSGPAPSAASSTPQP